MAEASVGPVLVATDFNQASLPLDRIRPLAMVMFPSIVDLFVPSSFDASQFAMAGYTD